MKELTEPMKMERMTVLSIEPGRMTVEWRDDKHVSTFPVRLLRRGCPCATCRVERDRASANPLHVVKAPLDDQYDIDDLGPVGRYAVNFVFSDGHSSGIFAWDYIRALCPCDLCAADVKAQKR